MHYLDEGPGYTKPVLLLHGVPAWSYLYRHMIKRISEAGIRVVAPDLIGFGKSDKPRKIKFHTYQYHVECVTEFIKTLKLEDITLFCHDWGSLIGLRIAAMMPDLFSGIIVSNGMLPAGNHKIPSAFSLWKFFSRHSPVIPVGFVVNSGTNKDLDKEERKAYRAPFPSNKYKAAIRALPSLVPVREDDPEAQINKMLLSSLLKWTKPFLTVFSNGDPITSGSDEYLQMIIPGAAGQDHQRLESGHFIQEDKSTELADIILRFKNLSDSFTYNIQL
jgi:haloalkane dehalogenase